MRFAATAAVNKLHIEVYKAERDNVGAQAAHRAELLGESAYRGGKRVTQSAYRFHKNRAYRKVAKLETKSIRNQMRLSYKKALRENPKVKSNPVSRLMQKRKIKRQYAAALRNAKKSAVKTKRTVGAMAKVTKLVTGLVRRNPALILKICLLLLLIIMILALFNMCAALFSGGGGFIGAVSYAAEIEDIELAALKYTELETDLRVEIENAETTHSGYDEYHYNIGFIGHDPFQLMAFLTAVYEDFIYADVEPTLLAIFAEQYQLEFIPEVEIRIGWDAEAEESYEYEWHILNVVLTSQPFSAVIGARMDEDQKEHFDILMESKGARQFVGNPFDFNWIPFLSSHYGYRIHPIHGDKRLHRGIDIGLPEGTAILAGFDGTVAQVGYDSGGYGNFVVIDNGDGVQARYAHCHTVFVTSGQAVEKGQVIATVGNTGASTGAHLHMEVLVDGAYINPLFFVEHN
jgi:murein DD-endopeptidase MepM/ murein hydrolase activator NlpD